MPKIGKIIGPPGTGKTTALMELVGEASRRYMPKRIGAISFTNTAVEEIKNRVSDKTGTRPQEFENIRTVHSQAWRLLGLEKDNLAEAHIGAFNAEHERWAIPAGRLASTKDDDEDDDDQRTKRTLLARTPRHSPRSSCIGTIDAAGTSGPKQSGRSGRVFWLMMNDNNLCDFTGVLERCLERQLSPAPTFCSATNGRTPARYECAWHMWSQGTISRRSTPEIATRQFSGGRARSLRYSRLAARVA